ncbi:hypothetical protein RF11_16312 [Thelohanellus kitauei]|uniref:Uncharacterized protein n=1 Tax=Thelohanellus kitauei TaxID=669202 RepID=A0A0C2NBC6_THEKT|nr:hypothetical protein RF11_16312 [Thelohanellus kitauei]
MNISNFSSQIIGELMSNSLLMFFWNSYQNFRLIKLPIKTSIYSIKCLNLLIANKQISEILYANKRYFFEKFNQYLNDICDIDPAIDKLSELKRLSTILKTRLDRDNGIKTRKLFEEYDDIQGCI